MRDLHLSPLQVGTDALNHLLPQQPSFLLSAGMDWPREIQQLECYQVSIQLLNSFLSVILKNISNPLIYFAIRIRKLEFFWENRLKKGKKFVKPRWIIWCLKNPTNLQSESPVGAISDLSIPSSPIQEMQLGNCNFSEFKQGMDADTDEGAATVLEDAAGGAGEELLGTEEQSNISLPKFAHLGFHVHPTKTPTTTAIHSGAMSIISSAKTSPIVGLRKISNNTETNIIWPQKKKTTQNPAKKKKKFDSLKSMKKNPNKKGKTLVLNRIYERLAPIPGLGGRERQRDEEWKAYRVKKNGWFKGEERKIGRRRNGEK